MTDEAETPPTTDEAEMLPPPELALAADHVENSTDATRGEPLAVRAQKRQIELRAALEKLGVDEPSRKDIELAIWSIETLLPADASPLSHVTASDLSRALERSKHLGETAPATDNA